MDYYPPQWGVMLRFWIGWATFLPLDWVLPCQSLVDRTRRGNTKPNILALPGWPACRLSARAKRHALRIQGKRRKRLVIPYERCMVGSGRTSSNRTSEPQITKHAVSAIGGKVGTVTLGRRSAGSRWGGGLPEGQRTGWTGSSRSDMLDLLVVTKVTKIRGIWC